MISFLVSQFKFTPDIVSNLTLSQLQALFKNFSKKQSVTYDEAVRQIEEYRRGIST